MTICGLNGIIMYSRYRKGVKNLLSPEESNRSLGLAINSWKVGLPKGLVDMHICGLVTLDDAFSAGSVHPTSFGLLKANP